MDKPKTCECEVCASISLKRMYLIILELQEKTLDSHYLKEKEEMMDSLLSLEHDIRLLNDSENRLDRDLFH